MGIFLKKLALFTLLLLLILVLMDRWMDHELYPHYPLQYDEVFHPQVNADVVILGASHATHGINPKYLESDHLKIYNFSLNGASPSFNLKWYQEIFQRYYKKPSHVIYGVHWVMFDSHFLKRRFEQDSKYFPFHFFVSEMKDGKTLKALLLNRFSFIRERKQLVARLIQLFKKKRREVYPRSEYYHGFIPFETRRDLTKEVMNPKVEQFQLRAFEELLNEFERDGIKVIFVEVPGYLYGFDSSSLSENIKLLKKIADERKIPFLDYETERVSVINTNDALFSDSAHLNRKGSEAFSKLLRRDLEGLLN
jgi:hypothetical protein